MKIEANIDDMVKRSVKKGTTSGQVHVPKAWVGKYVVVCLLAEEQQEAARELEAKTIPLKSSNENVQALKYSGIKPQVIAPVSVNENGEIVEARDERIHQTIGIRGSEKEFGALPDEMIWVVLQK
ncbi:MAG: DUF2080 family transposase-associated protein [Euryarchaeota archaeon]|nr:DUF2080 family transposase-associated protein [Euryarchaeota archaeon]